MNLTKEIPLQLVVLCCSSQQETALAKKKKNVLHYNQIALELTDSSFDQDF
jgi:hypothetical protein